MSRMVIALVALVCLASGSWRAAAQQPPRASKPTVTSTEIVNLNAASSVQIAALPGIGAKTADLIVQYREKNGPFKKIEEIMNVRGVGEKSFLRIKDRITVAGKSEK